MSKQLSPHIKKESKATNPVDNESTMKTIGDLLSDPSNPPEIIAFGVTTLAAGNVLGKAIIVDTKAQAAAVSATEAKINQNGDSVSILNTVGEAVENFYPGDTVKWKSLGFAVTSSMAHDVAAPGKVIEVTFTQGDYLGTAKISFPRPKGAEEFSARITIGDPTVDADYIQVTLPKLVYTKATFTIQVPTAYLNKTVWVKITALNSGGAAPESDPFGGIKIQGA